MRHISVLFMMFLIAMTAFSAIIEDETGRPVNGLLRVSILAYSEAGELIWTGTTDGSLPSLRVENGKMVNLDDLIPSYVKTGDLRIEIRQDGRLIAEQRMESSPLRRSTPEDPDETSETMATHLKIGDVGETDDLVVHSPRTGFGIIEPVERVDIDGALGLREGAAPTATTDFGKVYVDDGDGHLYFLDESGVATDLLETSSASGGVSFLAAFQTEEIHVCVDQTLRMGVHLSAGFEPYTHLWTGDTGPLSATDIPNPTFTAATPGIYELSYTITDSDGASSRYLFAVSAHEAATPTISASPSSGGCTGEPVRLVATGCYDKYCWEEGPCTKVFDVTESGTYHLSVRDEWGCEASAEYTVTFLPPPTVDPGTNVSVCHGTTDPTLGGSPSASGGTPPYFYEWTGTGTPYLSSTNVANPTFNATSASIGVYNLTLQVIDGSGCSSTSSPITVTIWENPDVSASSDSPVCLGDPINLISTPTDGTSPYSFSWSGPSGFSSAEQNPVISVASLGNAGTYTVTVTDAHGCVSTSASTSVTVLNPPAIATNPGNLVRCTGESAVFSMSATGDGLTYQWQVDDGGGYSNISGETTPTLTLSSVNYSLDGNIYRCVVSGSCPPSVNTTAATLSVREPASIIGDPSDITVCEDSPATFDVTASGYSLTYQWERSTDGGSSWSNISGETGATLTVTPPDDTWDGYRYRCTVTDGCAHSETSGYAELTVNAKPQVITEPVDQTVDEGETATFTIAATGTALTYQWQENTGSGWANISGATTSAHTITSPTESMDGYQYRCIATGTCPPSDTSASATLNIVTSLFSFTSHTFTNCGRTGINGPSLSQCRSAYSTSWDEDPAYFNMTMTGIQRWTVPADGTYRITCAGAMGGRGTYGEGGTGAEIRADFTLTRGEILNILVGQEGTDGYYSDYLGGGGGGSFVWRDSPEVLLIAAGGGGGGGDIRGEGGDATYTERGSMPPGVSDCITLAPAGSGWTGSYFSCSGNYSGGGAGWNSNGGRNMYSCSNGNGTNAIAPRSGGTGGQGNDDSEGETGPGGFGGGGGGATECGSTGGGGGGGYTGGPGSGCADGGGCGEGGGGGGSYDSGTNRVNLGTNSGHGYISIELLP